IFNIYEVVDGQQRVTTIYLFLIALARVGKTALLDQYVKSGNVFRLALGNLNGGFLQALVDGVADHPQAQLRTNQRLKEGATYFEDQLRAYGEPRSGEVARYIQLSTFALEFAVEDEALAIKAFES